MGIPQQVRKQAEEAEQLAVDHGLKEGQGEKDGSIKPAAEVKKASPVDDWEKRFKNYKVATDKSLSDLRNQLSSSQQQVTESQRQVQELIAKAQEAPVVSKIEDDKPGPKHGGIDIDSLPAEMREKYEDDFLISMSQLSSHQMVGLVGDLQKQIDDLKGNVETVVTTQVKSARDLYYDELDDKMPDWEQIGAEQGLNEYLINPVSDFDERQLKVVFDEANANGNAKTVLKILAAYKKTAATAVSESAIESTNALDELASPEGGNAPGSVIDDIGAHTETFTESQVNKFYAEVTKNKYSPEEATAIETQIQAAQVAGKILQG